MAKRVKIFSYFECTQSSWRITFLEILSSPVRQAIEQFKSVYTWTSPDGKDEEKDGLTILALVLDQI
jgi:hypothetical protein